MYASNHGAKGRFIDNGDLITVCDIKSDGYKAILWIWDTQTPKIQWYRDDGYNNGKCTTKVSPLVMVRNDDYEIQVCIAHYTYSIHCGKPHPFHNYS